MTRNLFLGADLTSAYLTGGGIAATEAFLVGAEPQDLRSGLWPSDHAGVVATLGPV